MPLQKSKKILIYFFVFLLVGTLNNKNISDFELSKINQIEVSGLSDEENAEILESLEVYKVFNLFFLNKIQLNKLMNTQNHIEEFFIFKKYPSSLNVKISKTKPLAYINKDNQNFYIGSNRKLIKTKNQTKELPYIYGNLNLKEFFNLKDLIDKSNFKFSEIKNLFFFPSGRWDLELNSGILIKLPKLKLAESLNLYSDLLKQKKFTNINLIDLRQNNQVIINGK
jgi:cell division protein FtsQ